MLAFEPRYEPQVVDRTALVVHLDTYEEVEVLDQPQLVSSPP